MEAASKGYFGKPARDLTLGEAATLAGLIKSPNNLSPWHDKQAAQGQRDFVLGRMVDEDYISREQYQTAAGEELAVKPRVLASSDSYAMEAIRQQVIAQVGLDRAISEGLQDLHDHRRPVAKDRRGRRCATNWTRSSAIPPSRTTRPTRSTRRCSATRKNARPPSRAGPGRHARQRPRIDRRARISARCARSP